MNRAVFGGIKGVTTNSIICGMCQVRVIILLFGQLQPSPVARLATSLSPQCTISSSILLSVPPTVAQAISYENIYKKMYMPYPRYNNINLIICNLFKQFSLKKNHTLGIPI